jgi:hypothetical protein
MAEEQRVDPRYDPAFQRGFEGTVTSGLRSRTSVRRTAVVAPAPFRSAAPEPEVEEHGVQDVEPTASALDDEPDVAPEPVPVSTVTMRDLTRNPFVIALVVLGLALSLGGAAWANQARLVVASRGGASTELDYWFLEASVAAAPLTILAGIGILAGVLFIAAGVWNRRAQR